MKRDQRLIAIAVYLVSCCLSVAEAHALGGPRYVTITPAAGNFALVQNGTAAPLLVSASDWPGVIRAVGDLSEDVKRVTDQQPAVLQDAVAVRGRDVIMIGTIGKSVLIDDLIRRHKLDVTGVAGKWESAVTTIVDQPMPGIRQALVIAGSDKRGTIFGVYDLSEQIGVSPWYWWADVRVPHQSELYVQAGRHVLEEPAVKYRGIFLNDEAPSLTGWVNEKFGGFNSKFYVHVFELLLRMKANYLWPAMWNSAFNEDDPENPRLADEYGIVMGTSHHEPMLRAQQEWKRHGTGEWDYSTNAAVLDDFWRKGIERNKNYESTITLGMRGDGDKPMTEGSNIALLEKIVADQRAILQENMTPDIASEPKVWALYKEVQDYYEKGMRVPDDVTLLWCDDNWGNIRRLPTPEERKRSGGAGIYYHFDYVGGPRNYKWLNTYSITKVWEQMNLALEYDADRVWVVNVGDLKPMEFPIEFFLSMAHSPKRWGKDHLEEFTRMWAAREFGEEHAVEIASMIDDYTRYNSRRKPEQLEPTTFSLTNYSEADRVDREWRELSERADKVAPELPENERASFFELVQYPVDASATVAEMYIAAGRNALDARLGRAKANSDAAETRALFAKDAELSTAYNHTLLDGRWNHMMDQTHIGYTYWQEPPLNAMPAVTEVQVPVAGSLSVATEQGTQLRPSLGTFDSVAQQTRTVKLFNRGSTPVAYTVTTSAPWIVVSRPGGSVALEDDLEVRLDWKTAPADRAKGTITITPQGGTPMPLQLESVRLPGVTRKDAQSFVESDGYVAIEAADASSRTSDGATHWEELPGFGETRSAMTVFPVTAASNLNSTAGLKYRIYLSDEGDFTLHAVLAPTLNFVPGRGLRFAVSIDNGPRIVVDALEHNTDKDWEEAVSDGVKKVSVPLSIAGTGYHSLAIWMVDPGVVLERIELSHGPLRPSYLGPPESFHSQTSRPGTMEEGAAGVGKP
jgi:Glycosyl hydrolase family 115/Gylcosyl hydrolase family 115 C-terminal domain